MTMRERIARAICKANCEDPDEADHGFLGGGAPKGFAWQGYLPMADAVLAVMREPTPKMIEEGESAWDVFNNAIDIWTAMIDAAAREGVDHG